MRHGLAILVGRWDRAASLCTWQRAVMDGWRERDGGENLLTNSNDDNDEL